MVRDRVEKHVNVLLLILLTFISVVFENFNDLMGGKSEDREWLIGKWLPDEVKQFVIGSTDFVSLRLVDDFFEFIVNDSLLLRRGWPPYLKHITCFEFGFLNFAVVWSVLETQ